MACVQVDTRGIGLATLRVCLVCAAALALGGCTAVMVGPAMGTHRDTAVAAVIGSQIGPDNLTGEGVGFAVDPNIEALAVVGPVSVGLRTSLLVRSGQEHGTDDTLSGVGLTLMARTLAFQAGLGFVINGSLRHGREAQDVGAFRALIGTTLMPIQTRDLAYGVSIELDYVSTTSARFSDGQVALNALGITFGLVLGFL